MEKPSTRSAQINKERYEQAMAEKGMTFLDLAVAAGVDEKTARNARYKPKDRSTISKLDGALGKMADWLTSSEDPPAPEPPKRRIGAERYTVTLYMEKPQKEALRDHEIITRLLGKIICGSFEPRFETATPGSTKFVVTMTAPDILRLLAAMLEGDLDLLAVKRIELGDHGWLMTALALLQYKEPHLQPQSIKPDALSHYLQNRVIENDLNLKTRNCVLCKAID